MFTKDELIAELIKAGYLKTQPVIEAFKAIDRKDFLPEDLQNQAYENTALPIGEKQTISQPLVVAFMLELLELKPGGKILEIGTGSGWNTALMAKIIGGQGKIYSIERIEALHDFAKKNISKYEFAAGVVELILGDGSKGFSGGAPYDKIIAAASGKEIPPAWKEQLKIVGRIVSPVKDSIVVIDKLTKDKFETKQYFGFAFVPLVLHP